MPFQGRRHQRQAVTSYITVNQPKRAILRHQGIPTTTCQMNRVFMTSLDLKMNKSASHSITLRWKTGLKSKLYLFSSFSKQLQACFKFNFLTL